MESFGERLKQLRIGKSIGQIELAQRLPVGGSL
jgi:transcriptional regulator with XRE-family HTH domain